MPHLARSAMLTAFALALPLFAQAAQPALPPVVNIESGALRGRLEADIAAFKGVPYAAPPVGEWRWRPPRPAQAWDGVRDASDYGPDCMQTPFEGDQAPSRAGFSEDCLFLNVWAPAAAGPDDGLAVMVWIHGGGGVNGGSSAALFDGAAFARDGVILVSLNYRLGRFGAFAHPALTAEAPESPLGNYALMDMLAALEWVQRNIAAFGGDPDRVTIVGGSSGGVAVQTLLTSPAAEGLFAQAVSQSGLNGRQPGEPGLPVSAPAGARSGEALGLQIAGTFGVEGTGAAALAALRAIPAQDLAGDLNMLTMRSELWIPPMVDGRIVVEEPGEAMRAGRVHSAPYLIGANSADAFFAGDTLDEAYQAIGRFRARAEPIYDPDAVGDAARIGLELRSDVNQNEPARYFADLLASQGQRAFLYRFSYVADAMRDKNIGAPHGTESGYVFDTLEAAYGDSVSADDARMADAVHAYWVAFAKTGAMAPDGLPALPPFDPGTRSILDFTADGPVVGPDPMSGRLDFLAALRREVAQGSTAPAAAAARGASN